MAIANQKQAIAGAPAKNPVAALKTAAAATAAALREPDAILSLEYTPMHVFQPMVVNGTSASSHHLPGERNSGSRPKTRASPKEVTSASADTQKS